MNGNEGSKDETSRAWSGDAPVLAIVGAPNVGKSRLFNRLTGGRSIVHDRPGVTTDRIEGWCDWMGRRFKVGDTGGLIPGETGELTQGVQSQVLKGVERARLLLFVVDGRLGMTSLDQIVASILRRSGKEILLVVNKVDAEGQEGRVSEFYSLGFPEPVAISAEEGRGIGTLLERIGRLLPAAESDIAPAAVANEAGAIRLAVVGRPNVGKSTLFNRICGEERAVVSSTPGTTRDPVQSGFLHAGRRYEMLDTAGLRRKASVRGEEVELEGIKRALSAMKGADLVLVVLDAGEPATHQDLAVVGACAQARRPTLAVLNKIDTIEPASIENLLRSVRAKLHFSTDIPMLTVSARRGSGVGQLLEMLDRLAEECSRKVPTPVLNAALEEAVRRRSPSGRDRIPRLYYMTQTGGFPPSFVVFTNGARIDTSYRRYLARELKLALGFTLTPLALKFRESS